jgi:hypothetical protein
MISFALKSENNFFPILVSLKFSTSLQALFPARALSLSLSLSHREEEEEEENTTDVNARAREKITVRE